MRIGSPVNDGEEKKEEEEEKCGGSKKSPFIRRVRAGAIRLTKKEILEIYSGKKQQEEAEEVVVDEGKKKKKKQKKTEADNARTDGRRGGFYSAHFR